jgi:hypothetical protein
VTVAQAGIGVAPGGDEWGFRTAVVQAAHYAVGVVDGAVLVLGAALPALIVGGVALVAVRRLRPRARSGPLAV